MQVQSSSHSVETSHERSAGNIKLGKTPRAITYSVSSIRTAYRDPTGELPSLTTVAGKHAAEEAFQSIATQVFGLLSDDIQAGSTRHTPSRLVMGRAARR